jgi:hypothetical protein
MKKIKTFFLKNKDNLALVTNEVDPDNMWVFETGYPTRKFDGAACAIIRGELYKRYDVKKGRKIPDGAIPCQEADEITGHHPHWVKCDKNNPGDKYFWEAYYDRLNYSTSMAAEGGSYELIGEKVQGNPEKIIGHKLVKHGSEVYDFRDFSYGFLKQFLEDHDIEGIVFHDTNPTGNMCKIRKSDFGIKR